MRANKKPHFGEVVRHWANDFTVRGRVENTFDALGLVNKYSQVPKLVESKKTDYGRFLVYTLPAKISFQDIQESLHHLEEQAGGTIEIRHKGRTLYMDVCTYQHPKEIPYQFEPLQYQKMFAPWPVGYDARGRLIVEDLAGGIYHILVVGATGAGKSVLMHQWAWSSIKAGYFTIIINTAKQEHNYLRDHALVVNDKVLARKLLARLNKEMDRRQIELEKYEAVKIQEYPFPESMPYIVVLVDELADFQDEEAQEWLHRICFLGRNAGLSVIGATQRSSAKLFKSQSFTETKHLMLGRVCFFVKDRFTSDMALGNDLACHLPTNDEGKPIPGMAVWQYGLDKTIKTMYFDVKQHRKLIKTLPLPNFEARVVDYEPPQHILLPPR